MGLRPSFATLVFLPLGGSHAQDLALSIVHDGRPMASVVIAADAGDLEKAAAEDPSKYVEIMTDARLPIATVAAGNRARRTGAGRRQGGA